MQTQAKTVRPRRRDRSSTTPQRHHDSGSLPQRIARVRSEVFDLVGELQRADSSMPAHELERAGDQMQSIANQLGAVQAALAATDR